MTGTPGFCFGGKLPPPAWRLTGPGNSVGLPDQTHIAVFTSAFRTPVEREWNDGRGISVRMYFLFLFGSGIIIGLIVAAPIGPVNLICIRRTLAFGPLNGFFAGLGAALGDGVFAVVTGFGLTAISQGIEGYSTPLKLVGGLMLLGFGVHIFRTDVSVLGDAEASPPRDGVRRPLIGAIASTFALTITNPATLFGFAALFAGLSSLAGGEATFFDASVTVLGVVWGSTLWWFTVTTIVGIFHRHIDAGVMRRINHVFGAAVTTFGVVVLADLARRFF
jgi:threonine/homoserine/homoserine lactone efflux protein